MHSVGMGIDFGGGGGICMAKIAGYRGKGNAVGNLQRCVCMAQTM